MWRILNHKTAEDFVLATGETHTVREFTEKTFSNLGVEIKWFGKGEKERGVIKNIDFTVAEKLVKSEKDRFNFSLSKKLKKGDEIVGIDPNYYRPTEVDLLIGNPAKAKKVLGWKAKTKFEDLVAIMVKADMIKILKRGF